MFAAFVILAGSSLCVLPSTGAGGDELFGASAIVAAPLPPALAQSDPALRTFRQGQTFGYRIALAPGPYDVEMAFVELVWRHPGQRVFDVVANGKPLFTGVDLVVESGRAPSVLLKSARVESGPEGLRLGFRAAHDRAPVAWIRVKAPDDGKEVRFIDCGGDSDLEPASAAAPLSEQILPIFGSRAFIDLRPQWGDAEISARGKFADKPEAFLVGFETGGVTYALPFAKAIALAKTFESVKETRTVTSVRYDVEFAGRKGSIVFRAPFDPSDLAASAMPVFQIEFRLDPPRSSEAAPVSARVSLASPGGVSHEAIFDASTIAAGVPSKDPQSVVPMRGLVVSRTEGDRHDERALVLDRNAGVDATLLAAPRMLMASVPLEEEETRSVYLALFTDRVLVRDGDKEYSSDPASRFHSVDTLFASYLCKAQSLLGASNEVDSIVERATIPESLKSLLRVAIPSFLLNTCDAYAKDGSRFYSCIEGYCRYHATLDVELHASAFYAWFAPELLKLELTRWAATVSPDDVMCHDVGRDDVIGKQQYPHAMPIEENTSFVILLHSYWTRTGDDEFVRGLAPLVQRLLARVRRADADGDGLAETDVANTLDDGSPAVQYARGQTYLAVKTAAAHLAGAELADSLGATGAKEAATCRDYAKQIASTLETKSWRGTHYALAADRSAKGLSSPWAAKSAKDDAPVPAEVANANEAEVLEGADSANGLAALGVLDALRGLGAAPLPLDRLKADLAYAGPRLERKFVLAHAEHEVNGWVSTALVRDAVRVYLGDDPLANCDRYALLQARRGRQDDLVDWAGFCDSPFNRYLSYYPRGVVALALVDAMAGLRVDRRAHRVVLAPLRVPCELPLPAFADWRAPLVPWLKVARASDGSFGATIAGGGLLGDFDVEIDLTAHGGERITIPREKK